MISTLICTSLAIAAQASFGAPECPCINSTSAYFGELEAALLKAGYSKSHGTTGCKAYDADTSTCASYCDNPWCYVDMDLCPMNAVACRAAGFKLGSNLSAHCRSRNSVPSEVVSSRHLTPEYSYETCHSKDAYTDLSLRFPAGGELVIAVDASPPWIVKKGETNYSGPIVEFFEAAIDLYAPAPTVRIIPGWATSASRALFANSYTACVHDVAVGFFDLCVSDTWLTPERLGIASFTNPIRQDDFYLMTFVPVIEVTFSEHLKRVLRPLTNDAWAVVGAFLLTVMVALMFITLWDRRVGHLDKGWKTLCKFMARETCLSFFDVHHSFLSGETHEGGPQSLANLVLKSALAMFGLIILASYTASLASMLVAEEGLENEVQNIDQAVQRGMKICIGSALNKSFRDTLPRAAAAGLFVVIYAQEDAPRNIYAGECDVAIASDIVIRQVLAGDLQKRDCELAQTGVLTEKEAHCRSGFSGQARDDCKFKRVGEPISSQPVGFPVNEDLQMSMNWGIAQLMASGVWDQKVNLHIDEFPDVRCKSVGSSSTGDGLDVEALSGTFIVSFAVVVVAVLLLICQVCMVKVARFKHGDLLRWFDDEPEGGEQAQGKEVQREPVEPVQREHVEQDIEQLKSKFEDLCIIVQNIEGQTRTLCEGLKQQPQSSAGSSDISRQNQPSPSSTLQHALSHILGRYPVKNS